MNKAVEVLLTVLALAGMYCAIPNNAVSGGLSVRAQQNVMIADGSDPMPLCRRGHCKEQRLRTDSIIRAAQIFVARLPRERYASDLRGQVER